MWHLTIQDDDGKRVDVPLTRDVYDVGRAAENEIRLTERNVSRWHARIVRDGASLTVADLESAHGTYVNFARITTAIRLTAGDGIKIGEYTLRLEDDGVPYPSPPPLLASSEPLRGPHFVMIEGLTPGARFPIRNRGVIGCGNDADIRLGDRSVARSHCQVVSLTDGRIEVSDLGSAGIVCNGRRGGAFIMATGDVLQLGAASLRFLALEGAGAHPATQAWPFVVFIVGTTIGTLVIWLFHLYG